RALRQRKVDCAAPLEASIGHFGAYLIRYVGQVESEVEVVSHKGQHVQNLRRPVAVVQTGTKNCQAVHARGKDMIEVVEPHVSWPQSVANLLPLVNRNHERTSGWILDAADAGCDNILPVLQLR